MIVRVRKSLAVSVQLSVEATPAIRSVEMALTVRQNSEHGGRLKGPQVAWHPSSL